MKPDDERRDTGEGDAENSAAPEKDRSVGRSVREYMRGIAGGLIFSIPLLYTMEVWWTGFIVEPGRLMGYIGVTFLMLLGYNRFAGLRNDAGWGEVMIDSVEEMGIGLVVSVIVLWLLGRCTAETELPELIGKVIVEGMTVAVGVSVGTAQLSSGGDDDDDSDKGMDGDGAGEGNGGMDDFRTQMTIAVCGAVLFAMNIAPTEEVMMIAVEITHIQVMGLALASMAIGISILYYIDFAGSNRFVGGEGYLRVLSGGVIMYAIALGSAAVMLWFYGHFDGVALSTKIAQLVVLGVASTLGASAGRLLLQIGSGNAQNRENNG